jgi:hypothetical protein
MTAESQFKIFRNKKFQCKRVVYNKMMLGALTLGDVLDALLNPQFSTPVVAEVFLGPERYCGLQYLDFRDGEFWTLSNYENERPDRRFSLDEPVKVRQDAFMELKDSKRKTVFIRFMLFKKRGLVPVDLLERIEPRD